MNWFLIIVAIVVVLITIIINIRLLKVYLDPEEKFQGGGYFPKTVVILGLSMAAFISLLLPFDVANRRDPTIRDSTGGGLDVALLWQLTLWSLCGMVLVVLPFALYYYEAWDPFADGSDKEKGAMCVMGSQLSSAVCWTSATLFVFVVILCILFFGAGINEAVIPYEAHVCEGQDVELLPCPRFLNTTCPPDVDNPAALSVRHCSVGDGELHIPVSLFVATIAVLTCLGWILFVIFGGVGLTSLPFDMWNSFRENKLTAITRETFAQTRDQVKVEARSLMGIADKLTERLKNNKANQQKKVTAFQIAVEKLEKRHQRNQSYNRKSEFAKLSSPFVIYGRLVLAIFCIVWSALWICHIIVNNALDVHPLLNNMFAALDSAFSLFGVLSYASFSFYLLWATVNGCLKVGMNFLVFTIHPMKPGGTLMSSFVFNTILILLASVACVSFCAMSFRQYAANTVVDTLYGSYVSQMKYLSYLMQYLQYALLGFAAIGLCWFSCKSPRTLEEILQDDD